MSFNLKTGGAWNEVASIWAKVAGTWQQVQSAWIKVAGVWEQVYLNYLVTLSGGAAVASTELGVAGIRVNTDGTIDKLEDGVVTQLAASTDWVIPNGAASSDFDVRATSVTETGGHGLGWDSAPAADDTWVDLSVNRTWQDANVGSGGSNTGGHNFTLEIRYKGGAALDSAAYSTWSEFT